MILTMHGNSKHIYYIYSLSKTIFSDYEDFSNQRNISKVCMKSYDRKHHQNQKAPYRGGGGGATQAVNHTHMLVPDS